MREEEIRKAASEWMIPPLEGQEKAEEMLRDPGGSLVVCEVMLHADGGLLFFSFNIYIVGSI